MLVPRLNPNERAFGAICNPTPKPYALNACAVADLGKPTFSRAAVLAPGEVSRTAIALWRVPPLERRYRTEEMSIRKGRPGLGVSP